MSAYFTGFDFSGFWLDDPAYASAQEEYIGGKVSPDMLRAAKQSLRYPLPASYVEFISIRNGGLPRLVSHAAEPNSWADDHVSIHGIYGIDPAKTYSLLGERGNDFWISVWAYPEIGIYFADCPSAGHDMLCMDFTVCDQRGEPRIVHVDQECDCKVTFVAPSFDAFIRGLKPDEAFPPG